MKNGELRIKKKELSLLEIFLIIIMIVLYTLSLCYLFRNHLRLFQNRFCG